MKNKYFFILCLLLTVAIVYLHLTGTDAAKKEFRQPVIAANSIVQYFELLGQNENMLDKSVLNTPALSVVFIFANPCPTCEHNVEFWKKIRGDAGEQMKAYGVVLSPHRGLTDISDSKRLNFPLYRPLDTPKFKEAFEVALNTSQTVLIKNGRVVYGKGGILEPKDYFKIRKIIKEEL